MRNVLKIVVGVGDGGVGKNSCCRSDQFFQRKNSVTLADLSLVTIEAEEKTAPLKSFFGRKTAKPR